MVGITLCKGILLAACFAVGSLAITADPLIHEVYRVANASMFQEAQSRMDQVGQDRPNSGKVHFVPTELLAMQGRPLVARTELSTAERLVPASDARCWAALRPAQRRQPACWTAKP